jgi:hypothetical protein
MESRVHISIEVSNLQKSILFYENLFKHDATKVRPDYANFRLDEPRIHLSLVLKSDRIPKQNSNEHFGIELFQNEKLDLWLKDLQKKGLETRVEEKITAVMRSQINSGREILMAMNGNSGYVSQMQMKCMQRQVKKLK